MKSLAFIGMILAHVFIMVGIPELNYLVFFWVAPLFAAMVGVNALYRSSNPDRYAFRLLFWAVISQPVHHWFFGIWWIPNILFGLAFVAWALPRLQHLPEIKLKPVFWYAAYPIHFVVIKLIHGAY